MKLKSKLWKYATAFVLVFIALNPEIVELALFVDAVGLEVFLMLLEIQMLVFLSAFLNKKIRPIFTYVKCVYTRYALAFSWKHIKEKSAGLVLVITSPATLMCMLVFSAAIQV